MTLIDRSRGWWNHDQAGHQQATTKVDRPPGQLGHVDIEAAAVYLEHLTGRPCPHSTIRSWAVRGLLTRHGRDHAGRGLYDLNELHQLVQNDPTEATSPRGTEASYQTAHRLLMADRGRASTYSCFHCDQPARDWAYDHQDPGELTEDVRGAMLAYSLDPAHYIPLCRLCHRRFDMAVAK